MNKTFCVGIGIISLSLLILVLTFAPYFMKNGTREVSDVAENANGLLEAAPDVPGDCNKMKDSARETCFDRKKLSDILYVSNNIKECLQFADLGFRNDCLFRMARRENDVNYCVKIIDSLTRESCIQEIAINNNKPEVCEAIKSEPYEATECKDRVKATNIGNELDSELPVDYCADIITLEYSKLCMLNASKYEKKLVGEPKNQSFTNSWVAFLAYRAATKSDDCGIIELEGARQACLSKIDNSNYQYLDYDGDGLNDDRELWFGTDPSDSDTDDDGLTDYEEMAVYKTNPADKDTDGDRLNDYDEAKTYGSDPSDPDTDDDGITDGKAAQLGIDPNKDDKDHDGLDDWTESKIGTDPENSDTDGDGTSDGEEWNNGLDPSVKGNVLVDSDSDGLFDADEIFYGTDRLKPDTDVDGASDKDEVDNLMSPLGSGPMDFDGDGLSDIEEANLKTNPADKDTDGDGAGDGNEISAATDPLDKYSGGR